MPGGGDQVAAQLEVIVDRAMAGQKLPGQAFQLTEPNRVRLADITYLPTAEGWLYLAAVLDLAPRKTVGRAMRGHMRASPGQQFVHQRARHRPPAKSEMTLHT
ncbi:Mobile element protein [Azospirillum melinis]